MALFLMPAHYCDLTIGRYLQPEPMLSISPDFFRSSAMWGQVPNPYVYAYDNPIRFSDPDGLGGKGNCKIIRLKVSNYPGNSLTNPSSCECRMKVSEKEGGSGCYLLSKSIEDSADPKQDCPELADLPNAKACDSYCSRMAAAMQSDPTTVPAGSGGQKISCLSSPITFCHTFATHNFNGILIVQ